MAPRNTVTDQVVATYHYQCQPSRQRRTVTRWQIDPVLADHDLATVVDILASTTSHRDHNRIAAALIAAHQAGDDAATAVLLYVARKLVIAIDPHDRYRDGRSTLWAAVAFRLATTRPADIAAAPRDFLLILHGRLRRDHARPRQTTLRNTRTVDTDDLERHLQHHRRDGADSVVDAVDARLCLDRLVAHAAHDRRHQLVSLLRYGGITGERVPLPYSTVSRRRRRLAAVAGYAA